MLLWLSLHLLIGFPLGLLFANAFEWWFHKYVLHGLGKKKGTFWNFHWYEHPAESRRHGMLDKAYAAPWLGGGLNARTSIPPGRAHACRGTSTITWRRTRTRTGA